MTRATSLLLGAASLVAISCDSAEPPDGSTAGTIVSSVTIDAASDTLEGPGHSVQLKAVALNAAGEEIEGTTTKWSSFDEAIATVDASGRLQAEDFGQAFIRAEIDGTVAQRAFLVADVLPPSSTASTLAFVGVDVVTMVTASPLVDQTIVIRDGIISEMGPAATTPIPPDAAVIEAAQNQPWFIMPGLVDSHIHMTGSSAEQDDVLKLYVANGVTTVREMWANGNSRTQRDRIELGALGPRVFAASPGMDGPGGPWAGSTPPVSDASNARSLVRRYETEGYDFVKVYNLLEIDVYQAIMEEADAVGIRVIGHVPQKVNLQMALDHRQYSMEHLLGFGPMVSSTGNLNSGTLNGARVEEWSGKVAASGTWNSPTLSVLILSADRAREIRRSNAYRYVPPSMKN
ncbi:MAG: amidohydrolase family protein, partial [Rhodothermales bacterium]|nr:amidohydrolase family protein [Rhodothermales bacterium]